MKQYDAECPVCGRINRGLYLEETKQKLFSNQMDKCVNRIF